MLCILWLFKGMYTFSGNFRVVFIHQKVKSMCIGGAAPHTSGSLQCSWREVVSSNCLYLLKSSATISVHVMILCHQDVTGCVCSVLVWIDRFLIGMVQQKQSHRAQDPGCYIQVAERANNDRCSERKEQILLPLFLQLLVLFCFTYNRSLVCPCTVTCHFQVGESSSYIINLVLPNHSLLPELKALSQLCWMHCHETLHSTTSVFPYIRITFFVFHWQKWLSLFSV